MASGGGGGQAPEEEAEEAANGADGEEAWSCLTLAALKEDLAECEEATAGPAIAGGRAPGDEELRAALQRGAQQHTTTGSLDADVFFTARRALHGVAAELQAFLVQADTLQFDIAALVASLDHGPLRPPKQPGGGGAKAFGSGGLTAGPTVEELFGPGAAPNTPKPTEPSLPAEAPSLAEYRRRLEALPPAVYLGRPLRLCVGEVDRPQDEKDIGRDALVVNGAPLSGSRGGYAAAHAAIAAALRAAEAAAWPSEDAIDRAAQLLLSVLNRTCSGFAAFEEVLRFFDCPEVVVVSPDSAAARPLEAAILGGLALGRAHTRYAVRLADAADGVPLAVVDAVFEFRLTAQTLQRLSTAREDSSVGAAVAWPAEEVAAAVLVWCGRPQAAGAE